MLGRVARTVDEAGQETDLGYDAGGRLISVTSADGQVSRFTYDERGRLVGITGRRADDAHGIRSSRALGSSRADGNRVRSETLSSDDTTQVRDLLVDPRTALSQVVAVTDGGGELVEYYVRGLGLLAVVRPSETRYVHADGSGSIRVVGGRAAMRTDRRYPPCYRIVG